MKIHASNLAMYPRMYSFKSSSTTTYPKILQDKLPNPRLYADYNNPFVDWDTKDKLREEYCDKLYQACFDKNKKIDPRVVDYLDNSEFEFKTANGSVKRMTIGEALKDSIQDVFPYKRTLYHATTSYQTAQNILKEGFNPLKIARTKIGPGIYCTTSEGHAFVYSSSILKWDYEGTCANVAPEYYDRIKNSDVLRSICKYVGMETSEYPFGSDAFEVAGKMLNEYVRNYFVNNLGIDVAEGSTAFNEHSTVIYNFDKVRNLRIKD